MKKITLLLYFIACLLFAPAQTLVYQEAYGAISVDTAITNPNGGVGYRLDNFKTTGEKSAIGISTPLAKSLDVKVIGSKLSIANAPASSVEIFSALGTKVQTVQLVNGSTYLSNISKGLYIVRIGKQTAKIMIQ